MSSLTRVYFARKAQWKILAQPQPDDLLVFASHDWAVLFNKHGCLLASQIGREREKREREERKGVFCLQSSRLVVGLGFGCAVRAWGSARSDRLPCPCCFSHAVPVCWLLPGAASHLGFPSVFCFLACSVASFQGSFSPFLAVCFFPFVTYNYSVYPRYLQDKIRFIFRFFCRYPYYKE